MHAAELERKQRWLRRRRATRHETSSSGCTMPMRACSRACSPAAIGPLGDVIEHAWRSGARFDSWEDQHRPELWRQAFEALGIDPSHYRRALPLAARLPWDHIDVGLDQAFWPKSMRRPRSAGGLLRAARPPATFVHPTHRTRLRSRSPAAGLLRLRRRLRISRSFADAGRKAWPKQPPHRQRRMLRRQPPARHGGPPRGRRPAAGNGIGFASKRPGRRRCSATSI